MVFKKHLKDYVLYLNLWLCLYLNCQNEINLSFLKGNVLV